MAKQVKVAAPAVQRVKPAVAGSAPGLAPVAVVGKKVDVVHVHYKKQNTHVLHHVHAVAQGLNTLPKEVWEEAKKHPTTQALIKSGDLVEIAGPDVAKVAADAEAAAKAEADADADAEVLAGLEKDQAAQDAESQAG